MEQLVDRVELNRGKQTLIGISKTQNAQLFLVRCEQDILYFIVSDVLKWTKTTYYYLHQIFIMDMDYAEWNNNNPQHLQLLGRILAQLTWRPVLTAFF